MAPQNAKITSSYSEDVAARCITSGLGLTRGTPNNRVVTKTLMRLLHHAWLVSFLLDKMCIFHSMKRKKFIANVP